jgi:heme/copper-type cytochrome/quinol oxidase subunit 2
MTQVILWIFAIVGFILSVCLSWCVFKLRDNSINHEDVKNIGGAVTCLVIMGEVLAISLVVLFKLFIWVCECVG